MNLKLILDDQDEGLEKIIQSLNKMGNNDSIKN